MATVRIPIINSHTMPDSSGTVYFEPSATRDANDRYNHFLLTFSSQGARQGLAGKFVVPKDYAAGAKIVVVWNTTATSGDVVWDCDYTAVGGDSAETMDPAADQESITATDTASGTARQRQEVSLSATVTNFVADDEVLFNFYRDGVNVADTLAATAYVESLLFEYTT